MKERKTKRGVACALLVAFRGSGFMNMGAGPLLFLRIERLELEPQSELEVAGQLPGRVTGNCPEKRISNS
jgi:hypothetical protein